MPDTHGHPHSLKFFLKFLVSELLNSKMGDQSLQSVIQGAAVCSTAPSLTHLVLFLTRAVATSHSKAIHTKSKHGNTKQECSLVPDEECQERLRKEAISKLRNDFIPLKAIDCPLN